MLEFDTPQALLADDRSQFSLLVDQTGVRESQYLRMLANGALSKVQQNEGIAVYEDSSAEDEDSSAEDEDETDPLIEPVTSIP